MNGSSIRTRRSAPWLAVAASVALLSIATHAKTLTVPAVDLPEGSTWTVLEVQGEAALPALGSHWDGAVFWDLRPAADAGRLVRWSVLDPVDVGLTGTADAVGADRALCAENEADGARLGCRLFRAGGAGPAGPRVLWSDLPGDPAGERRWISPASLGPLKTGAGFGEAFEIDGRRYRTDARAVAEGLALLPAGPREVVVLHELTDGRDATRLRYRFLTTSGQTAAVLEGPVPARGQPFRVDRGELLASPDTRANDGIQIPYETLSKALVPGTTGFLQWSTVTDTPLTSLVTGWTDVPSMISIDQTGIAYQPDPSDPGSEVTLPEVWDFTGLQTANLTYRVFNTTRNDNTWSGCLESCAVRDLGPNPPDGTWQAILKIDNWDPAGALYTQDIFTLNDNDTGADPSIDVPYVTQDALNTSDKSQICFEQSPGGDWRLLRFFQFFGPDTANAVLGAGDAWSSGDWPSCSAANGLRVTLASICGDTCWPDCGANGNAHGLLEPVSPPEPAGNQPGLRAEIIEDGYVHVPPGNYVPALLMRQDTDLEAGLDVFGTCNFLNTRLRTFDYFWVQERYGLLALVSAPSDDTGTLLPDDWSLFGNITDGADFTWGPYPPYQSEAEACLSGTLVRWELPADGSNLNDTICTVTLPDMTSVPCIRDYGYVVAWGDQDDPETLADWSLNPNRTPLPGEAGYLLAPSGGEPTSTVITGWPGASINATVVTALTYTDPDAKDEVSYRSAAFYKVVEDPARLSAATFLVGDGVDPFVTESGPDLVLTWPAVPGAGSYLVRVYDLDTKTEIACPGGMTCDPAGPTTTHPGAAVGGGNFGYRAFAVDPCGESSSN